MHASTRRVALVNLGCRVNRVELDMMAQALIDAGAEICGQREADVIVINTCAVTGEAQAKTRKAVRHAARLARHPLVVATGCVASLFADELAELGDNVVVEACKSNVADLVLKKLSLHSSCSAPGGSAPAHGTTPTGRTRPGIKIQDGCDNHCTYCIVWKARGKSRSVAVPTVLEEVRASLRRGAQEVVLTGINLGNYRAALPSGDDLALPGLLNLILAETDVRRIRLSSIEPPDVTPELLEVMARAGERVAPFLHVCLQSGCNKTLHDMGRVYRREDYAKVVRNARAALPDLALGTDLIVGFPGETDEDFADSLAFCKEMDFARMHVFRYSRRPGTPAAARTDQAAPEDSARPRAQAHRGEGRRQRAHRRDHR